MISVEDWAENHVLPVHGMIHRQGDHLAVRIEANPPDRDRLQQPQTHSSGKGSRPCGSARPVMSGSGGAVLRGGCRAGAGAWRFREPPGTGSPVVGERHPCCIEPWAEDGNPAGVPGSSMPRSMPMKMSPSLPG